MRLWTLDMHHTLNHDLTNVSWVLLFSSPPPAEEVTDLACVHPLVVVEVHDLDQVPEDGGTAVILRGLPA